MEVALDTRRGDTLRKDGGPALDGPGDEYESGVLAQLLGDFVDGWVVDDTGTVSYLLLVCIGSKWGHYTEEARRCCCPAGCRL